MISKRSSLGNSKYENRHRIWVWIVSAALQIIFYPGLLEIYYSRIEAYWRSGNYGKDASMFHTQMLQATHDALCFKDISMAAVIIPAVLIVLEEFAYLYNKSSVDLYCSIPVSPKKKYINTYLGGICVYIIPYVICCAASLLIASGNRALSGELACTVLQSAALNIVFFLALYSLSVAVCMFSGNLIVACFAIALTSVYLDMWSGVVSSFSANFLTSATSVFESSTSYWSLLGNYVGVTRRFSNTYGSMPGAAVTWSVVCPVIIRIAVTFAVSAVVAYLAYMKRPAETAAKAVSTRKICTPLKIMVSVPAGLLAGNVLYGTSQQNEVFMVIAIIAVSVLTSMIMEAVFELDIHAAFTHLVPAAVSLAAAMLIFGAVRYDWTGYDSYVPNAGEIDTYAVYIPAVDNSSVISDLMEFSNNQGSVYAKQHMFLRSAEAVCSLHAKGVKEYSKLSARFSSNDTKESAGINEFDVYYRMKNGSRITRKFYVDMEDTSNAALIDKVVGNIDYVNGAYQFASDPDAMVNHGRFKLEYTNGYAIAGLNAKDFHSLRSAWMKDAGADMSYGTLHNSLPCGDITITYSDYTTVQIPVYDSFTATLDWLSAHNVNIPLKLDPDDIISAAVSYCDYTNSSDGSQQAKNAVYTDKADIEKLTPALYPQALTTGWTPSDTFDQRYSVDVTLKSDVTYHTDSWDFYCGMISGQVPQFVKERLEK